MSRGRLNHFLELTHQYSTFGKFPEEPLFLHYRPGVLADAALLLSWNGDFTKAWIKDIVSSAKRYIFIIEECVESSWWFGKTAWKPVGMIHVDHIEDVYELCWIVAPEARGRGIGSEMVKMFVSFYPKVRARIENADVASRSVAENAGLKLNDVTLHYEK